MALNCVIVYRGVSKDNLYTNRLRGVNSLVKSQSEYVPRADQKDCVITAHCKNVRLISTLPRFA